MKLLAGSLVFVGFSTLSSSVAFVEVSIVGLKVTYVLLPFLLARMVLS